MLLVTVNGIVIRERQSGDNDKFLDILTDKNGVVEVLAKGVKRLTSKNAAAAQLFAYSKFCLNMKNNRYYVESAEPIKIFYAIREDLEKLALASYFSEIISYAFTPDESGSEDILRLFLNVLHFLSEGKRENALLKSIFELRFMSESGQMPNLIGCVRCCTYLTDRMYFVIGNGTLYCENCFPSESGMDAVPVGAAVVHALRQIALTDMKQIFNFNLTGNSMKILSDISERYLLGHLGRHFKTLDFYKSLINPDIS